MEAVREFAEAGGPVLGICNGFQVLCEARLLPGALLPNEGRRFVFRQVDLDVVSADTPVRARACAPGDGSRSRSSTRPAATTRQSAYSTTWRHTTRSSCATPPGTTPTARCATSPASSNRERNVMGLMPHPEHAVDPLTGSADGLKLFESAARELAAA